MQNSGEKTTHLKRAVLLMTASSFLIPLAGLMTQPILARGLGAAGRGELAAAMAPAVLLSSVATLGLPDALTYLAGRRPRATAAGMGWASVFSIGMGGLCVLVAFAAADVLSDGDEDLAWLIVIAMVMWLPLLIVGVLRGAARGEQAWTATALESVINTALRVICFVILWLAGGLSVLSALLVTALAQTIAGLVYVPMIRRAVKRSKKPERVSGEHETAIPDSEPVLRSLMRYGSRVWFGSVAGMLVARTGQLLMVPLSSTRDLGLYTVAVTVSDLPILVAMSVAGALQGVNARSGDSRQVALTTRLALLVSILLCGALAALTPLGVVALFGEEFRSAVVPTLMLLVAAALCVPGFMAGAGLAAFDRPGLRSLSFLCTFVVNLVLFVILVPSQGVIGACWAGIAANATHSIFAVLAASRVMRLPVSAFVIPRPDDVRLLWRQSASLLRRVVRR